MRRVPEGSAAAAEAEEEPSFVSLFPLRPLGLRTVRQRVLAVMVALVPLTQTMQLLAPQALSRQAQSRCPPTVVGVVHRDSAVLLPEQVAPQQFPALLPQRRMARLAAAVPVALG